MDFKNKEKKELNKIAVQTEQLTENTARTEKSVIKEAPLNEGLAGKDINNLIKEPQQAVPGTAIKKEVKSLRVEKLSPAELAFYRSRYTDEERNVHETAIKDVFGYERPVNDDMVNELYRSLRGPIYFLDANGAIELDKHGNKRVKDFEWNAGVDEDLKYHIEWLKEYHKLHNDTIAEFRTEEKVTLKAGSYRVSVKGPEETYEYQGSTLNCYCCAGTAMLNQYLRNKGVKNAPTYNQYDMRAYRPKVKKFKESFRSFADEVDYGKMVLEIDGYAGKTRRDVGNIFQMGDFFIEKMKEVNEAREANDEKPIDLQLNRMYIQNPAQHVSDREERKRVENNIKAAFTEKIAKVLETGNVVSLLLSSGESGHYITVTGINGDELEVLDSLEDDQKKRKQTRSVKDIMKKLMNEGKVMELAWLSDGKSSTRLTKEYSNLQYEGGKGYYLKNDSVDDVQGPAQTMGIAVSRTMEEMGPGKDGISEQAYIPNPLAEPETETIEEQLKKYRVAQEEENKRKAQARDREMKRREEEKKAIEEREAAQEKARLEAEKKKEQEKKLQEESQKESIKEELQEKVKEEEKEEDKKEEEQPEATTEKEKKTEAKEEKKPQEEVKKETKKEVKKEVEKDIQSRKTELEEKEAKKKKLTKEEKAELKRLREEEQAELKRLKEEEKEKIKTHEKSKDYATYGVAFDLKHVSVNAADSSSMAAVKTALQNYLRVRAGVFEKNNFMDKDFIDLYRENNISERAKKELEDLGFKEKSWIITNSTNSKQFDLGDFDRQRLGEAYDAAFAAVNSYIFGRHSLFKHGRGKARLEQVKLLRNRLKADNIRFWLSSNRRSMLHSIDNKYERGNEKDSGFEKTRKELFPHWISMTKLQDQQDIGVEAFKILRAEQRKQNKLPGIGGRMMSFVRRGFMRGLRHTGIGVLFTAGLIDRGLGLATMLAANTLELAGKVIKAPLKLLSGAFNKINEGLGSKKRWRMDYSLATGWKSVDDGRRIFRRYLKGACILPAAVIESVTRGVPYIFGHRFKSGVYKRTSKWSKDIFNDVKNVFGSLSSSKKYAIQDRADEDVRMAGGYIKDEGGNLEFYEGDDQNAIEEEEYEKWEKDWLFEKKIWTSYMEERKKSKDNSHYEQQPNRKSISYVKLLAQRKGDSIEESVKALKNFNIIIENATDEEKNAKAAEWERLFNVVLETDMSRFSISSLSDIVNGRHEDIELLSRVMFEIQETHLDEYETLRKDKNVKCELSDQRYEEFRLRWKYLKECDYIDAFARNKEIFKKYNINPDAVLKHYDLAALQELQFSNKNKEKDSIISALISVRFLLDRTKCKSLSELPLYYNELRVDQESRKADERIKKHGVTEIKATQDNSFVDEVFAKFGKVYEKDTKRYDHSMFRMANGYVSLLHKLNGDTVEQGVKEYGNLILVTDNASVEEKNAYTASWERVFDIILNIDMKRFFISNMSDMLESKNDDLEAIAVVMFDTKESFLKKYEKMIADPDVECALTEEQFKEVLLRWEFIHTACQCFQSIYEKRDMIKEYGLDVDEEIECSKEELDEKNDVFSRLEHEERNHGNDKNRMLYFENMKLFYQALYSAKDSFIVAGINNVYELRNYYNLLRERYNLSLDDSKPVSSAINAIHMRQKQ